jgi:hypothetical protein
MRQIQIVFVIGMLFLAMTGIALSQQSSTNDPPSFEFIQLVGEELPRGVEYDPNFDQLVMVDAIGRLLLVDARTFQTRYVLYETGNFYTYEFSHDGRWLAVAVDTIVEIWDTQTGTTDEIFNPGSALSYAEPLLFSEDDQLLLVTTNALAPDDIRRSETDTATLTWLWDIGAQRGERQSILRESTIASPFFDQRNQIFALGPNNLLLATRVDLIQILGLTRDGYPQLAAIEVFRSERDPADVWFSQQGDQMYFRPLDQSGFYQIDTNADRVTFIPTGRELDALALAQFDSLVLGEQARIIGESNTRESNSLLRALLGEGYRRNFNDHPLTAIVVDILKPVTLGGENFALLVYIADEQTGRGYLDVIRPDAVDMALHPDGRHLALRRTSGEQPIEIYDMATGELTQSIVPTYRDEVGRHLLAFNRDGSEIISHFQRFDVATGDLLHETLTYHPGFEQFFFSEDSRSIITRFGSQWWQWDIASGQVLRRETVDLRGEVLRASLDNRRFLTRLDTEEGTGVELVNVGTDERRSLFFEQIPGRFIEQVIPSPNWENYLVVYSPNEFSPHYPGNEIALYNLYDGQRWFIAGADLPANNGRDYGWTDDGEVYIASFGGGRGAPDRIYGLDYHPSGLPACLVEAFPEEWTQWTDLWERLNNRLSPDGLGRLTQKLCEALPGTIDDVEDVFFPTATPTRIPVSPTPSFIAGVPACLTAAYPGEGLQYAQEWRDLVTGLTPERVAEVEVLLCDGLRRGVDVPPGSLPFIEADTFEVMTIDLTTGIREQGTFLPATVRESLNADLVYQEFVRTEGYEPLGAALSPDAQLYAIFTPLNHVAIYRLIRPYDELVAQITATAQAQIEQQPTLIALAPTATAPFERLGLPLPTLTPTVTQTPPPPATESAPQAGDGEVVELCETADTLFTVEAPPVGYAPGGRLLVRDFDTGRLLLYNPATGESRYDERIINPERGQLSFDQNWLLLVEEAITVARADGSDPVVLFDAEELPAHPDQIYWLDPQTVEFVYRGFIPDRFADAVTLIRQYNAPTGTLSEPFVPPNSFAVNELPTEILAPQPARGSLALVSTSFNAGLTVGYKFYIYDRETGTADYFARVDDGGFLEWEWHPLGTALYYRYPNSADWYIFDTQTRQHRLLGELPGGQWSRDGRYRVRWASLPLEEIETRLFEDRPLTKLTVWDSQTGQTRRYCIPQTGTGGIETVLYWSPNSRYLAFLLTLPADQNREVARPRTLILDTETGSVTQLSFNIGQILVWLE